MKTVNLSNTTEGTKATQSILKKYFNTSIKVGSLIKAWDGAKGKYRVESIKEDGLMVRMELAYTYKNK